jgi:hypothetical protein
MGSYLFESVIDVDECLDKMMWEDIFFDSGSEEVVGGIENPERFGEF